MSKDNKPLPKRPLNKAQRARLQAGKEAKPAWNVRSGFVVFIIGVLTVAGVYLFLNRENYIQAVSNNNSPTPVTCTVEKVNNSKEFSTDCGRFIWGEQLGAGPYGVLSVGSKYDFTQVGARVSILGQKPTVTAYQPAP